MEQNEASKARGKKKKKAWHEINHPAEKGHGHGPAIIVENIADVFLVDNFYVKGQIQEEAKEINFCGYTCLSWRALISGKVIKKQFVFYERWEFFSSKIKPTWCQVCYLIISTQYIVYD